MNPKDAADNIESTVVKLSNNFIDGVDKTQNNILRTVNARIKDLEVKNGSILTNRRNLRLLRDLRAQLQVIVVNPAYKKKLDTYIDGFEELKVINDEYFESILSASFAPSKQVYKDILNQAIEITKTSLLETGISENVIKPIEQILNQNITTGGLYTDLEKILKDYITGNSQKLGGLERYVTQISRDALNQYSANYTQAISNDLDLEWYYYSGGTKSNTRSYCASRAGKYFTLSQIKKVPKIWSGRIDGTNSSNILTYRGGYNCLHQYYPVLTESVPKEFKQ